MGHGAVSQWADLFTALSRSSDTVDTMRQSAGANFIVSQCIQSVTTPDEPVPPWSEPGPTFDPTLGGDAPQPQRSAAAPDGSPAERVATHDPAFWRKLYALRTAIRQYDGNTAATRLSA
jgi:hypothetical protein